MSNRIPILFILLAILSLMPHLFLDRFEAVGPEMLHDEKLSGIASVWQVREAEVGQVVFSGGVLRLQASSPEKSVIVFQSLHLSKQQQIVSLQGSVAWKNVIAGMKPWNRARLLLVQYKGGKGRWDLPHDLATITENSSWQRYNKVFVIAPDTQEIRVVAQLSHCSGILMVKNLRLHTVREAAWYGITQKMVRTGWIVFLSVLIFSYVHDSAGFLQGMLLSLCAIAILICVAVPGRIKIHWKNSVERQIDTVCSCIVAGKVSHAAGNAMLPNIEKKPYIEITKIGHFLLFAILGGLFFSVRPHRSFLLFFRDVLLFAGATEMLQLYIAGRSALPGDVLIDVVGAMVGRFLAQSIKKGIESGRQTL